MKKNLIFCFLLLEAISSALNAQTKNPVIISKKEFVGTWQRNSKIVGNGLVQNFQFFENSTFRMNLGDDRDDLRSTIRIDGKFRLSKDSIFFTIFTKTIVDGNIGISDHGISQSIFEYTDGKVSEIKIKNPTEIKDPCFISVLGKDHIKINNEEYFKVKN
jgi:hypothetical protein